MTFIIDIDGTICNAEKLPSGSYDYPNAIPIQETINKINQLYDEGHKIFLFTARGYRTFKGDAQKIKEFHKPILISWLAKHNVKYHELHTGKPWGQDPVYIDNRNLSLRSFITEDSQNYENLIASENLI